MLRQVKTLNQEVEVLAEPKTASSKWFLILKKFVTVSVIVQMIMTMVVPAVLYPLPAAAQGARRATAAAAQKIQVIEEGLQALEEGADAKRTGESATNIAEREGLWIQEWLKEEGRNTLKHTIFAAVIEALNNLLNQIAYDTATWLASGGEGQQPLFYTEGWGEYLRDAVDGAAGEFLNDLAGNWVDNLNLCEPSFNIKIGLTAGISGLSRPRRPDCSVTDIVKNWNSFVQDENFLDRFELAFQSGNNDVTIGLEVFNKYYQKTTGDLVEKIFGRATGSEFKGIVSKVSNIIKTPGTMVENWAMQHLIEEPTKIETSKAVFGDLVLNPIATFLNTLVGKLFQRLFEEGLADDSGSGNNFFNFPFAFPGIPNFGGGNYGDLYTGQSGSQRFGGRDAAELRFLSLFEAGRTATEQYDVLTRMAFCSSPDNPGPDECVITQGFRSAVEQQLTLKEAIRKGLINGDAPFGFTDYDPSSIYNGIPYRSIVILRAHRIVPVGWELAAQAAKKYDPGKTFSLNYLMAEFENSDGIYYGLVDPQWVLKAPSHICKAEGYGPKIVYESVIPGHDSNNDNDFNDELDIPPSRILARAEYCADYQTCLEENDDGTCKYYGYCAEEKRTWNLQGSSCPDTFNTCQTFQAASGRVVSYLENSLDYNGCNIDNAGCQWYCQDYNAKSDVWTCLDPSERVLTPCNQPGGCNLVASCVIPKGGYTCSDVASSAQANIGEACGPSSEWWNGSECVIAAACSEPIPFGGVSCTSSSCDGLVNLLPNSSFEKPYTQNESASQYVAEDWYVLNPAEKQYWQRVTGSNEQVYPPGSGSHSIRYYIASGTGSHRLQSDNFVLPIDSGNNFKFYTLSGRVFNNLNAGTITLEVEALNEAGTSVVETTSFNISNLVKNSWHNFSFEFKTFGQTRVNINVNGNPKSGTAWFDEFKVSESCIAKPVRITLSTGIEKDQSKLHLDRDAQACNQSSDGCSEFIRTLPNGGTNLVVNSSFEDWVNSSEIPPGWASGENHPETTFCSGEVKCERVNDSPIDNYSLKLTNDSGVTKARDFETAPVIGMRPDTTYRVSFWAKTDYVGDPAAGSAWYSEILSDAVPNDSFCKLDRTIACYWPNGHTSCQSPATGTGNPNDECLYDYTHLRVNNVSRLALTSQWQRFVMDPIVTRERGFDFKLSLNNNSTFAETLYIDGIQIEEVDAMNPITTGYKDYGDINQVYLKKPPASIDCQGYSPSLPSPYVLDNIAKSQCVGDTMIWREDACDPSGQFCCHQIDAPECYNYAFYCQPEEVGCESYRPLSRGAAIPGVVGLQDYCPLECVGYEAYKQSSTLFENQESLEFFIPDTAVSCNASQAGCDEFTNLDEVALGGEGIEHYKYLRLCEKPSEASCQNFFAWQGSEETGFQLKIYNLSAEDNQPKYAIDTSEIDRWPDEWCSNKTLDADGLPQCCNEASDLEFNPFCKQLVSITGETLYRIYDNTISCSLDCHPFRKTRLGETDTVARENCEFSHGRWDAQNGACIYQAIPNQGIGCSADAAGCREYRGNTGANVFTTYFDNFEDGNVRGWHYGVISSEALTVAGHSIATETVQNSGGNNKYNQRLVTSWAVLGGDSASPVICSDALPVCNDTTLYDCFDPDLGRCLAQNYFHPEDYCSMAIGDDYCGVMENYMTPGRTYIISFWAKSGTGNAINDVQVQITPGYLVDTTSFGPDWNYYKFGPFIYDEFKDGLRLRLVSSDKDSAAESAAQDRFYVDNVEIKEVKNYEYVVKNSWQTPVSCDTNPFVTPPIKAPQFMLGCSQYFDSYSRIHNLKSFTSLCREEAIGCEALIDTHNSSDPFEQNFNPSDGIADVKVPADNLVYMTTRASQQCNAGQKGCQAVGLPRITVVDNTSQIVSGYQTVYLINDPDKYDSILCESEEVACQEWQSSKGFTYFKDPGVRTCEYRKIQNQSNYGWFKIGSTSEVPDCPLAESPLGGVHPGPDSGGYSYAGICPNEFSGCTQFIDSTSSISKNHLFNGTLDKDFNENCEPDGWTWGLPVGTNLCTVSPAAKNTLTQDPVAIQGDTIYVFGITTKEKLTGLTGTSIEISECPGYKSYDHSIGNTYCSGNTTLACNHGSAGDQFCSTKGAGSCTFVSDDSFYLPPDAYQNDTRSVGSIPNFPENEITYSARFVLKDPRTCKVTVKMPNVNIQDKIKEIFLRKAAVDYVLESSVDRLSCNGVVDLNNECVLFNDRSRVNYNVGEDDIGYLSYDADTSGVPVNNGLPVLDCAGPCDSNVVLKVRPDRTCESWLYCKSAAKVFDEKGGERTECLSLGLCNSLDESGNCNSNILVTTADPNNPLIDNRSDFYQDIEQISNLSGFSRAGFYFSNAPVPSTDKVIKGYFPYAEMTQEGSSALLANGNFETVFDKRRKPIGWAPFVNRDITQDADDGLGWMPFKYIVEDDLRMAYEGAYLKLNTSYQVESSEVDVEKNAEYILSGWINTFNLSSESIESRTRNTAADRVVAGQICLDTDEINPGSGVVGGVDNCRPDFNGGNLCCLSVDAGSDWTHVTYRFKTAKNTLKVYLQNDSPDPDGTGPVGDIGNCRDDDDRSSCDINGYSLFDEISLQPVLRVQKESTNQNDFINRTCRLYPEANSLACRYYRDKTLYAGRDGYCLTSDPANPSQCIQWWPVDSIAGEGNDEFFSPDIPAPLYYCIETDTMTAIEEGFNYATFDTTPEGFALTNYDEKGTPSEFLPFKIPQEYFTQFRFPYVDSVDIHYDYVESYYERPFIMANQELSFHIQYPIISGQRNPFAEFINSSPILEIILEIFTLGNYDPNAPLIESGFINTLRNQLRDQILNVLPAWAEPMIWFGISDWTMEINTEDSEKNGVVPIIVYVRGDVVLMATIVVGIIAIAMGGAAAADLLTFFSTAYELIAAALPIDWIGFYLHTFVTFTGRAAEDTALINSMISGISVATSLAGAAPEIMLAMLQVISDGLFAFDIGDWNDIWDIFTTTQDFDLPYPSQAEFSGWFGTKFGPYSTFQVITDRDKFAQLAEIEDPIPEINGDVLGALVRIEHPGNVSRTGMIGTFNSSGEGVTYCKTIVQTVDASGTSKAWLSRVFPGSKYVLNDTASGKGYYLYNEPFDFAKFEQELEKCSAECVDSRCRFDANFDSDPNNNLPTNLTCETSGECVLKTECNKYQSSDFQPFGAAVPPTNSENPENWDTRETAIFRQPLFYEPPLISISEPHQARMGEAHQGSASLRNIFLKSYGVWQWTDEGTQTKADDRYLSLENIAANKGWNIFDDWEVQADFGYCPNNARPDGAVCRQRPIVNPTAIKVNGRDNATIRGADSVQLDFTVIDDPNQLPIVSYNVFWGDGGNTAVSGTRLRDRPSTNNPFTTYHTYDHWEIQRYCSLIGSQCDTTSDCSAFNAGTKYTCCPAGESYCRTKIRIKVRDNWNAETCCNPALDPNCQQNVTVNESFCSNTTGKPGELPLNKYIPMSGVITVQQ